MRMVLYILIIASSFFVPVQKLDVAKLQPVEAVAVCVEQGQVVLKTDADDIGRGETAYLALEDLKRNAIGVIYLDTAEFLLVEEGAEEYAKELEADLKRGIKVGKYDGGSVKDAAKYLDAHAESAHPESGT